MSFAEASYAVAEGGRVTVTVQLSANPERTVEIIVFAVSSWDGEPTNAAPDEHSKIGWFEADALPDSTALDLYRELVVETIAAG